MLLYSANTAHICSMKWRMITGLLLLIFGIRAFYISYNTPGTESKTLMATMVWVVVGLYFVIKGAMMRNSQQ